MGTAGPCGPDAYGYYAYDSTDIWTGQAPVYEWVDITGVGSLITDITNADAMITTLDLPFVFRYYGTNYTQVSVCSNGFLAMGFEDYLLGDNSGIPDIHGPASMIAPFWDDLDPSNSGDIYQWFDSANHRWIVQFDEVVHYGGNYPETFQVIFYDVNAYPTTTGDGVLVFQYQTASYVWENTVGIENFPETVGIQYVYDLNYDPCAAPITNESAIKFTSEPPGAPPLWLVVEESDVDDTVGGNGNGFAEPGETVDITLTLRNLGDRTASGVTASIATSDPDATIVNGSVSFGDIDPSASAVSTSPFTVTIAAEPTGDTIEFDFHVSATTGARYDTWDIVTLVLTLDDTGIEDGELPLSFALRQNAPNPFRDGTAIAFDLPSPARTRLEVYNVAGRRVATVVDETCHAGRHTATWNGLDAGGRKVAAGIYFYRLTSGESSSTKKMLLLK
jgi:hypothetical protein